MNTVIDYIFSFCLNVPNSRVNFRYERLIASAKRRNKEFNLPKWYVRVLLSERRCRYSNVKFNDKDSKHKHYRTFERIDPSRGYVIGNVIVVARHYNSLRDNDKDAQATQARYEAEIRKIKLVQTEIKNLQKKISNADDILEAQKKAHVKNQMRRRRHLGLLVGSIEKVQQTVEDLSVIVEGVSQVKSKDRKLINKLFGVKA